MTEMLAFARRPGETINALLARYEIVRQRAATEGQFVMSIEGCSLQVLRACNVQPSQLMTLLQPFGGRMPENDQEFAAMCTQLRRWGHVAEGTHGNIATVLSGPLRQARPHAYFGGEAEWPPQPQPEAVLPNAGTTENAYFGGRQDPQHSAHPTDATQPLATWALGGGVSTEAPSPTSGAAVAYPTFAPGEDTDTDSDTSSDSGTEELSPRGFDQTSQSEAAEHIYLQYRKAKKRWRRFTGKPVRKFRRYLKSAKRAKGKGKGRNNVTRGFMWTHDDTLAYLKGKGKGNRAHTSGKGFGRRKNPKDRDGNIMKCRICGSDEHFAARCHQKGSGKGSSSFTGIATAQPHIPGSGSAERNVAPPWEENDFAFAPPGHPFIAYDLSGGSGSAESREDTVSTIL